MNTATPLPSIFDTQSLSKIKSGLNRDDPKAVRAAAQQFEALMLQMMLKSMRAAMPQEGLFDSEQTRFYQELLDSQMAQVMASKGGTGLAAILERQLSRRDDLPPNIEEGLPLTPPGRAYPLSPAEKGFSLPGNAPAPAYPLDARPAGQAPATGGDSAAQQFVTGVWPQALAASRQTGLPAHFMVAHAALESGWGRAEPRFPDGRPSHNLFGIKAGSQWAGPVVEASTIEYANGIAERRIERFRAYPSYAAAFDDYARLLATSPRYADAVASRDPAGFARNLQRGGYATDPDYAAKLERVIVRLPAMLTAKG